MSTDLWLQQIDKPLYPDLLWSRPETRHGAGKLLIIGGQAQEFIHVAESYATAEKAGAGTIRVFMPESTRKLTRLLPGVEYAPANSSGSFARKALDELIEACQWADGVLLAGNLGRNSETSLLLESLISKYKNQLVISGEALPSLSLSAKQLFERDKTVLALNRSDLQKFGIELALQEPITSEASNVLLAKILKDLSEHFPAGLNVVAEKYIWTAAQGKVAATKIKQKTVSELAAASAVWTIQNPAKTFEALTTAAYC